MKLRRNKKGFTLAELLVVVAIMAVLVAIAIPIFNSSTAKAEEAVEVANARSCYAQGMVAVADGSYTDEATKPAPVTYGDKTYTFTYNFTAKTFSVAVEAKDAAGDATGAKVYNTTIADFSGVQIDGK